MRIENLDNAIPNQEIQNRAVEATRPPIRQNSIDSVEISDQAKRLLETKATQRVDGAAQGEKVAKADSYDKSDSKLDKLTEKITKALVDSKQFKNPRDARKMAEAIVANLEKTPEVRLDKVLTARQRADSGFYDQKEVYNVIAENLLKDVGIE